MTKYPFKVVSYTGSLVSRTAQHTFLFLSLESPTPPTKYLVFKNCLPHLLQNMIDRRINLTILVWIQNGGDVS